MLEVTTKNILELRDIFFTLNRVEESAVLNYSQNFLEARRPAFLDRPPLQLILDRVKRQKVVILAYITFTELLKSVFALKDRYYLLFIGIFNLLVKSLSLVDNEHSSGHRFGHSFCHYLK